MIMKNKIIFALSILTGTTVLSQGLPNYAPGQIIVKTSGSLQQKSNTIENEGTVDSDSFFSTYQIYKVEPLHSEEANAAKGVNSEKSFVYYTNRTDITTLAEELTSLPEIEIAHPNYLFSNNATPDDNKYDEQWSLPKIKMPGAWDIQKGCSNIKIAVLDAGFRDLKHNDIDDKYVHGKRDETDIDKEAYEDAGYGTYPDEDYVGPDDYPDGLSYHGLHVASVAGAETDNNKGMAGVAWNNEIVPVRCGFQFYINGYSKATFEYDDIVRAIDWVVAGKRARVINMSFGSANAKPHHMRAMEESLEAAHKAGIVLIASSGNDTNSYVGYPANSSYTIAVGASDQNDNRAIFSNYGSKLDLVAPGVNVFVLKDNPFNRYEEVNGTSFSSPMVAGVAALILSQNPSLTPEQVREVLRASADEVAGMNGQDFTVHYGYGRLNAEKALKFVPEVEYNVVVSNKNILNVNHTHATNSIKASNYIVSPNGSVRFKAGEFIQLNPDFEAKPNSSFEAYIGNVDDACSGGSYKTTPSTLVEEEVATEEVVEETPIKEETIESSVFPNPISDQGVIKVELKNDPQNLQVYVTDLMGREVKRMANSTTHTRGNYSFDFNLSDFKQGIYFVVIKADDEAQMHKVIYKK